MIRILVLFFIYFSYIFAFELSKEEREFIEKHPTIILGGDPIWPPFLFVDSMGKLAGYDMSILSIIEDKTGIKFKIKKDIWPNVIEDVRNKKIDGILTGVYVKDRSEYLNFSNPYVINNIDVLVKKDNPKKIFTIEDFEGKVLSMQKDEALTHKLIKNIKNLKVIVRESRVDAIEDVISGRADIIIDMGTYPFIKNSFGNASLTKSFTFKEKVPFVFSIRKDWPELTSIINKVLAQITIEEKIELEKNWFGLDDYSKNNLVLNKEEKEYISNKKEIKVCSDPSSHSFSKKDDKNTISNHFLDKILLDVKLKKIQINTKTWEESLSYIRQKKCDIIVSLLKTKKKNDYINFTNPYVSYPLMIVTHYETPYLFNLETLKNKKFAILKGHANERAIKKKYPNMEFEYVDNVLMGLKMLQSKKVFGYIEILPTFVSIFKEMDKLKINRKMDVDIDVSIGIRKDDPILYSIIQKSLYTINENDKKQIFDKFIEMSYSEKTNYLFLVEILLVFSFIILLILYWNYQLKIRVNEELLKNKKQERMLFYYSNKDEMKNLVGNISHQWRQPIDELSSVLFYLETKLLLGQDISRKELENNTKKSREIINFLSNTINIFSNFYIKKERENLISVSSILKKVIFITEGTFKSSNIKINLTMSSLDMQIKGDELQQVILAIFNNIKNIVNERKIYSSIVKIRLYKDEQFIVLEIEDNCGGIKKDVNRIFDLGESDFVKGTGLGLYISKRIVQEIYEGTISARNSNEGAVFKIRIPNYKVKQKMTNIPLT